MKDPTATLWKALTHPRHLFLVAGPCVIETEEMCLKIGRRLQQICSKLGITYIFKASYDKANRTSAQSFRGPGLEAGLEILEQVRRKLSAPVLTDVHSGSQASIAGEVVDILQIPAFLCRQTDLIDAAVTTGKIVNLKKGQFLSPSEMGQVVKKAESFGGRHLLLTERGTTFGYQNLVADMRSIPQMRAFGYPVIFDATHSVQLPGGGGDRSSGQSQFAPILARAAVAVGANGVFFETHPKPEQALSDGPNMVPLRQMPQVLADLNRIFEAVR